MAKKQVSIVINNQRSRVVGNIKVVIKLREQMKIKSPGYFWSTAWRERKWDGYVRYITENGIFMTGLVPWVIKLLTEWKVKYKIQDARDHFKSVNKIQSLGNLIPRGYQYDAINSVINNQIGGVAFRRGILAEATNAGKNLIAAGIFMSFAKKRTGIFLIDNTMIFKQAVKELGELMPGEVGQVSSNKVDISKRVTICMVQSLASKMKKDPKLRRWLAGISIFIADECDTVATRKDTKQIVAACYDTPIRIGMSGTPLKHKDKTRNQEVLAFFGPVLHVTTNKQLVDMKVSSKPTIEFYMGNIVDADESYVDQYNKRVIHNKLRNKKIWRIARRKLKKGPVVILIKNHKHIKTLLELLPSDIQSKYTVKFIHHEVKARHRIIEQFNKEQVDVLIASMIIRRGMNLKLMRSLINAAGGDSHSNILQLLGRALRLEKGKKEEVDVADFWDEGRNIRRHSKHRIRYYKEEGFPVKELYKKCKK